VAVLEARDLWKTYRGGDGGLLPILSGIDLSVNRGEMVAIVGSTGAGKSTLLHILGALDPPTKGYVILAGEPIHGKDDEQLAHLRNKAVGFVSYGAVGGTRAVEHLRLVAGALGMADVSTQVALSLITEFENFSVFKPGDYNVATLNVMLNQVLAWTAALAPLRATSDPA